MKTAVLLIGLLLISAAASAQVKPVPGQWYRLEAKHSGMFLDVTWGSPDEHAPVGQSPKSTWEDGAAQLWTLVAGPNELFRLKVKHSGKFLEVKGGSAAEHAPVSQTETADTAAPSAQLWKLVPWGGEWYRLQVDHSKQYLDVSWGSRDVNAPVAQAPYSEWEGGDAQLWRFVPDSPIISRESPVPPPQVPQRARPPLKFVGSVLGEGLSDTTARVRFTLNQPAANPFVVIDRGSRTFEAPARLTHRSTNRYEYEAYLTNLKKGIYYFTVFVPLGNDRYLESGRSSFNAASPVRIDPHPPTTHERWGK